MESTTFVPSIFATIVAALATFLLGGLWYGPLFGKAWQRGAGLTDERLAAANMARTFGLSFVLAFVAAWVFGMFLGPNPSVAFAIGVGALAGLCWVGAALAINDLFEQRSLGLWAINAGYHTLAFTIFGLVFGLWP
jgi:hypothetical protein